MFFCGALYMSQISEKMQEVIISCTFLCFLIFTFEHLESLYDGTKLPLCQILSVTTGSSNIFAKRLVWGTQEDFKFFFSFWLIRLSVLHNIRILQPAYSKVLHYNSVLYYNVLHCIVQYNSLYAGIHGFTIQPF